MNTLPTVQSSCGKTAWGVDVYTAFYVALNREKAEVIGVPGQGSVGRDSAGVNHEQVGLPFTGDQYTISVLAVGDTYRLPSKAHPHGEPSHPNGDDDDALALMAQDSGDAFGFRMRFTADRSSEVAWNEDSGYSMFNARLQISTVTAKINGIGP